MKRVLPVVLAVCVFVSAVSGCGGGSKSYDFEALSEKLLDSDAFSDILNPVDLEVGAMVYGFEKEDVSDCKLYISTQATTEEIALFKCVDEEAARRVLECAEKRAVSQKELYESYAPAEPPKLADGYIKADGVYVFYIIAAEAQAVRDIMK